MIEKKLDLLIDRKKNWIESKDPFDTKGAHTGESPVCALCEADILDD